MRACARLPGRRRHCFRDAQLIAIFSLLGLGLFGGGLYAIYDGWPYLVLERGFTEVIIGSIAATGGLIMLSLAWVLKQVGALRAELAEAAEARTLAPAPADAAMPAAPPVARGLVPADEATAALPALPVTLGVGATGAAVAVAAAVAEPSEAAPPGPEAPERDLFGAPVADHFAEPAADEEARDEEPEPARDEAVPDMFEPEAAAAERDALDHPAIPAEPDELAGAAVEAFELPSEDARGFADHFALDEAAEATIEVEGGERPPEPPGAESEPPRAETEDDETLAGQAERDEFAALRESLTNQLGGLYQPTSRIEPSLAPEDTFFAREEAWTGGHGGRREPSFDTSSSDSSEVGVDIEPPVRSEPAVPAWPPRTEPHAADVPSVQETGVEAAPFEEAGGEPAPAEPVLAAETEPHEVQPEADGARDEAARPDAEPAVAEPAASEEGIVGAYQVGETHFTIYADGSIRARTPDGEYSFASMDELKVYLASEKSRLGV